MTKYCTNESCIMYGKSFSDELNCCPQCGEILSDRLPETTNEKLPETSRDELKADYSTRVSDSHDHIVNNSYSNDVVNKVTHVYVGKSKDEQTLPERLTEYRKFCQNKMRSEIISARLRQELDDFAMELNLDEEHKSEIESSVKKSKSLASRESLSKADRVDLENTIKKIWQNTVSLSVIRENLAPFANSESDEAQFYNYMIAAIENPRIAISKYNQTDVDNYWQTFWACLAFRKQGQNTLAKQTARKLQNWEEYPEDNINIVYCMLNLLDEDVSGAQAFLSQTNFDGVSEVLIPFRNAILYLTEHGMSAQLTDSPKCNFYLQKIFGIKNASCQKKVSPVRAENVQSATFTAPPPPRQATEKTVSSVHDAITSLETQNSRIGTSTARTQTKPGSTVKDTPESFFKKNKNWIIISVCVLGAILMFFPKKEKSDVEPGNNVSIAPNAIVTTEQPNVATQTAKTNTAQTATTNTAQTAPSTPKQTIKSEPAMSAATAGNARNSETSMTTSSRNAVKEDPIATLKTAADQGNKDARFDLGMRYYNGDGVAKSYSTAFNYLKPLAEEGYTKAFFPVAEMYHGGRGVAKDRDAAEKWYTLAAKAGNEKAKRILMNM